MKYNKISKKYILSIKEFMENFLNIKYEGKNKLTHKEMSYYLYEKNRETPKRVSFKKLKKEKILRGHYLIVEDESNTIIPYYNPKRIENLMIEMLAEQRKNNFSERRAKILCKKRRVNSIQPSFFQNK
ncbi:MAG: hypothetical protein IKF19_07010 [Bacilli bacterium]|nr:hypothetical protein [Bacilli bacterium]